MSIDLNGDECIHGIYLSDSCSLCNGRERREQADRDRIVARWAAKFPGVCRKCGDGIAEGVVAGAGWPLTYVSPAKWKRDLRLSADKGASRRRAIELWPSWAELFARVKDDGRAEAALIAHWWLTKGRNA